MKIRRVIIFIVLFFIFLNPSESKAFELSNNAEISILTCSPGNEMYSVYGHSAIRIKDIAYNYDVVFNYGIFDFNTPNFLYRFASGQTDYLLGAYDFESFYEDYVKEKRSILEQVLNLSKDEKQKVFNFLIWNAKPENRVYRYDFFFDNCATRVRDVVQQHVNGVVVFPAESKNPKTLKQLIKDYHGKILWLDFGIDLVVCAPSDREASVSEEMFLPDYVMDHFSNSVIRKENGAIIPLVKTSSSIYEAPEQNYSESKITGPFIVFLVLAVLVMFISFRQFQKNKITSWLDYLIYGINGLMGVIIFWFVLYSEHPAMHPNYNLMWAIPLNLIFILVWTVKKWRSFTKYYHVIISVWLIMFLFFGTLLPQTFHVAFYCFVLMVLSRSLLHSINILKEKRKHRLIQ